MSFHHWLFAYVAVAALAACGGADSSIASQDSSTTSQTSQPAPHLTPGLAAACAPGAELYSATVIAAYEHPTDDTIVVCWADGLVAKSPPPQPGSEESPRPFDRLAYTAHTDGSYVETIQAGYRDRMIPQPP
jgi:hypothetical protein